MLNIKDIQEKLKAIPEPKEVAMIREKIKETFNSLEFVDPGHKYFLNRPDGIKEELMCVSELCKKFEIYEDWDARAIKSAKKKGVTVEALKKSWHESNIKSTNNGTSTHLFAEMYMHFIMGHPEKICDVIKPQYEDGYLIPYSPKQEAVSKFYEDLFYKTTDIFPVMPETKVYTENFSQNYAGTFDALFATYFNGKWCLLVYDWKTNKSLENPYHRRSNTFLLNPFSSFIDEPQSHYTIQLSAYSIPLIDLGFEVIDRKLLWLKDDGEYEMRDLPDVTNNLRAVLK